LLKRMFVVGPHRSIGGLTGVLEASPEYWGPHRSIGGLTGVWGPHRSIGGLTGILGASLEYWEPHRSIGGGGGGARLGLRRLCCCNKSTRRAQTSAKVDLVRIRSPDLDPDDFQNFYGGLPCRKIISDKIFVNIRSVFAEM